MPNLDMKLPRVSLQLNWGRMIFQKSIDLWIFKLLSMKYLQQQIVKSHLRIALETFSSDWWLHQRIWNLHWRSQGKKIPISWSCTNGGIQRFKKSFLTQAHSHGIRGHVYIVDKNHLFIRWRPIFGHKWYSEEKFILQRKTNCRTLGPTMQEDLLLFIWSF